MPEDGLAHVRTLPDATCGTTVRIEELGSGEL
jgi:hypothetical protein